MKITSLILLSFLFLLMAFLPFQVSATHSWGGYHWARTSNPFTLKLGDNVTSVWDAYLIEASSDWSASSVLDTTIVTGAGGKNCKPKAGRIEVCNRRYGNNGWLGVAQIWVTGGTHITQAVAKMNDTYFSTLPYNTPAWKRLVMCQEIAHGFGLDHQDEAFDNANLGTCMDYTSNPLGPPSNEHPNTHDYDMLMTVYEHLDTFTTINQVLSASSNGQAGNSAFLSELLDDPRHWGKRIRDNGRVAVFEKDFGHGNKVLTHVLWATE